MNIMVLAKLAQDSLHTFVEPLAAHDQRCSVFVVRDIPYRSAANNVFNVRTPDFGKTWLRHLTKLYSALRCVKNQKVNVIVSIHLYPHGYLAWLLSILTRKPLIHVVIAGKREFFLYGRLIEKLNHIVFRKIRLMAVTGSLTKNYLMAKDHAQKHIAMLPNVIRTDMFFPIGLPKVYDIVFAARIDKNKNIDTFLKALRALKDKGRKLKAAVTGKGTYESVFKVSINTLGLDDTVDFLGWIDYEELPRLYNQSKIFVLTSRGEGFPLAVLEAMACGTPPICTEVGDIPDVVRHNVNGLLLSKPNDDVELYEFIENLLDDQALYQRLSDNAKTIRKSYSIAASAERWRHLLNHIG